MGHLAAIRATQRQLGVGVETAMEHAHDRMGGGTKTQAVGNAGEAAVRRMLGGEKAPASSKLGPAHGPPSPELQDHLDDVTNDIQNAPDVDPKLAAQLLKLLERASHDELAALDEILDLPGQSGHIADFFAGAHTVARDGGALYQRLRKLPGAKERISSHKSKGPQYNIIGQAVGPILFSDTVDGASTWFQLEGYRGDISPEALPEILPHMVDYLKYLATHRNQSRFGSSGYTDSNPLLLAPGPDAGGGPTQTV